MGQTTSSSDGRLLAREVDAAIDELLDEFDRLIERQKRGDEDRNASLLVISGNSLGIYGIGDFFQRLTVQLMLLAALKVSLIYGISISTALNDAKVQAVLRMLQARYRGMVEEARLLAIATGGGAAEVAVNLLITPRNVNSLRKAVEFAATFSAQHGIYQAGRSVFTRKRAVAVLDGKTTRLCRDRMHGQVVAWDGYFIDPLSGSRWLHPPFVGGKLGQSELYHECRSASVPDG